MPKLNKAFVGGSNLAPGWYRDDELKGFCLRVRERTKVFCVNAKVRGTRSTVTITIGPYPSFSAEEARAKARIILNELAQGINPKERRELEARLQEKQRAKLESQQALREITLRKVLAEYFAARDLKESTVYMYRCTVSGALSDWLDLPIQDITKDMVEKRHRQITEQGHKGAADSAMRILRALLMFAMAKYEDDDGKPIITFNPVSRLSHTRSWNKLGRRQSVIKSHQLKAWCKAVYELENEAVRDYLLFLLFTGLRKNEAASLLWRNVDMNRKGRTILIEDSKNRQAHMLPMSDFVYALLKNRWHNRVNDEFVFGACNNRGYIYDVRHHIELVGKKSKVQFMLHDLRRTFLTIADSLDLSAYAIKRLANHKMTSDVTAGYIVSDVERLRRPMIEIANYILKHGKIQLQQFPKTHLSLVEQQEQAQ
jgi:integrase